MDQQKSLSRSDDGERERESERGVIRGTKVCEDLVCLRSAVEG